METMSVPADPKPTDRKKRKGPGRTATSGKAIETLDRHAQWVRDRLQNLSLRAISERDRVSPSTVHEAVSRAMERTIAEPTAALRAKELQALEALLEMAMGAEDCTDLERVYAVLKVIERRHKVLGIDAPMKVEAKLETETVDVEQLRALLRPLGWDIVPLAIETTGEEAKEP